jgi:hypothetical protein
MNVGCILGLIGEFAGLNIRVTKRNKLYKRITVIEDNCKLLGWEPIYYCDPIVTEAYRRITAVYLKTLEFQWWCDKTPFLKELAPSISLVVDKVRKIKRIYENNDYLFDYKPVTRMSTSLSYAVVPGMGLRQVMPSSYGRFFSSLKQSSELCTSFCTNTPF